MMPFGLDISQNSSAEYFIANATRPLAIKGIPIPRSPRAVAIAAEKYPWLKIFGTRFDHNLYTGLSLPHTVFQQTLFRAENAVWPIAPGSSTSPAGSNSFLSGCGSCFSEYARTSRSKYIPPLGTLLPITLYISPALDPLASRSAIASISLASSGPSCVPIKLVSMLSSSMRLTILFWNSRRVRLDVMLFIFPRTSRIVCLASDVFFLRSIRLPGPYGLRSA